MADSKSSTKGLPEQKRSRLRLSLSSWIFISVGLGILCGLFFGESCERLRWIGDAFIRLLQMTILPYIVVSLMHSIGGLTIDQAKRLAGRAGVLMLILWGLSLVFVLLMTFSFPVMETASFFSTSDLASPPPVDLIALYIPTNPFNSLANQIIPAVVLFVIVTGVALIGIPGKEVLLDQLAVLSKALTRVANGVAHLTPVGVFALSASAAGTMTLDEFERVQTYLIGYCVASVLMAFVIMPFMISMVTPFKFKDILRETKDAMVTGFSTANLFITLPLLTEACRRLFQQYDLDEEEAMSAVNVVLPTVFSFPAVGKLLVLLFVPFAGWYVGQPMEVAEFIPFSFVGLLTYFGSSSAALPFLLDWLRIPADLFELYIVTSVIVDRFSILSSGMHLVFIALIVAALTLGLVKIRPGSILKTSLALFVLMIGSVVLVRIYLEFTIEQDYTKDKMVSEMQSLADPVEHVILDSIPENRQVPPPGMARLDHILERGVLRFGYREDRLPWSYRNSSGELVGFDIEVGHLLARELKVSLEFIPTSNDVEDIIRHLQNDEFDILMSGLASTPDVFSRVRFANPHIDVHAALVMPDHRRKEFSTLDKINRMENLKIGVPNRQYFIDKLQRIFPNAELVPFDSLREYFESGHQEVDVVLASAEGGSAWTLLYPSNAVVILQPGTFIQPVGYPVAMNDGSMVDFLNQWLDLKTRDGSMELIANHWLYGKGAESSEPRWSIIRDVLHWVD
ncbi:MAG: cation:dicarboxylase symporter family transporter [Planctomycetota bacterium]|nr:cation:dicarboxylase symporter family transporter [Planctomycetota bacterium]